MTWRDGSWDFIKIDGVRIAALLRDLIIKPTRDVQQTQTPGTDGPDLKDQGYKGASVNIILEVFKASKADALVSQLAAIHPRQPGALSKPHTIEHPIATAANVDKIYIIGWELSLPKNGIWTVPIEAFQWFPSQKKKTNQVPPDGGPLDFDPVPPPDPENLGPNFT